MIKKIFSVILILSMIIAMTACGNDGSSSSQDDSKIEVTIDAKVHDGDSTPRFKITSNLPDETSLLVTLEQGDYKAQTKVTLSDGEAVTETFSNKGQPLSGKYTLRVIMPVAEVQPDSVKEVIGDGAKNLSGSLIVKAEADGLGNTAEAEFNFSF